MKKTRVILKHDHGLVRNEKEGHQIHAKGFIGEPLSGGGLRLDLVELGHLLLKGTVSCWLKKEKRELGPAMFLTYCQEQDPGFDTRLKLYQELKGRGFVVKPDKDYLAVYQPGGKGRSKLPWARVRWQREGDELALAPLLQEAGKLYGLKIALLLGVIDAEGDVIYFKAQLFRDEGEVETRKAQLRLVEELTILSREPGFKLELNFSEAKGHCFLGSADSECTAPQLIHSQLFFGKPFAEGLTLGPYEGRQLLGLFRKELDLGEDQLDVHGLVKGTEKTSFKEQIYQELKARWLVPKTGFKYGSHFRVYRKLEEGHHAEFLIHCLDSPSLPWLQAAIMVRLATGVRKEMVFAFPDEKGEAHYLKLLREIPSPGKE